MIGGVEVVTVGIDLMEKIIKNQNAKGASEEFIDAWEEYTGERCLTL